MHKSGYIFYRAIIKRNNQTLYYKNGKMNTSYTNFYRISELQEKIVRYIDYWSHTQDTPISRKKILEEMESVGEKKKTIIYALDGLLRENYIRREIKNASGPDGL